jgi:hypothetical protein
MSSPIVGRRHRYQTSLPQPLPRHAGQTQQLLRSRAGPAAPTDHGRYPELHAADADVWASRTVVLAGLCKVLDSQESWVAYGIAWSELQTAVNDYRLVPADRRSEDAQRLLMSSVNEVMTADVGRWASRRRDLAEGRR